jgi:hypothetical protein
VKEERFLDSFWVRNAGLLSIIVVLIVSALGLILDLELAHKGMPRSETLLIGNVLPGVTAGFLFYQFARRQKKKNEIMRERIATVAKLNHDIRNALHVIRYEGSPRSTTDATQLQLINESVARIEWALRQRSPQISEDGKSELASGQIARNLPTGSPAAVDDFVLRLRERRLHNR